MAARAWVRVSDLRDVGAAASRRRLCCAGACFRAGAYGIPCSSRSSGVIPPSLHDCFGTRSPAGSPWQAVGVGQWCGENVHHLASIASRSWNHVGAAKEQAAQVPVGLLHLERLTFVPAGMERGELVYSVPLSPGEEVSISHKEWTTTSEKFSRIVTDFPEAYSEEGVTEKAELSQSTSSQKQHSSGFTKRSPRQPN